MDMAKHGFFINFDGFVGAKQIHAQYWFEPTYPQVGTIG